jgi:Na+-translocating ferredoxin:NAD+ oxidoreductase RNF subunit RnfB
MMLAATDIWSSAWLAGATMLGLGGVFAIVLLIASEKLKVQVDPKIERVYQALPHIDCGACGYAGCASYAKAVAEKPSLIGKCAPGGQATCDKIAAILNLQISDIGAPKRPVVYCRAHTEDKTYQARYQGIWTCTAANALANAQGCKFGCLGYGDCVTACKFDALHIVDGLATVDYEKCTGCTACSKACPRNLIEMVPFRYKNIMAVACKSEENGANTRKFCKVGCIACTLCAKQSKFFSITNNLARCDYDAYSPSPEAQAAMDKCPTGVIVYRGKSAPQPRPAGQKAAPAAAAAKA